MPLGLDGGIAANHGLMARFGHETTPPGLGEINPVATV
jgi:hypothetical protein